MVVALRHLEAVSIFGRFRPEAIVRWLADLPPQEWPKHLRLAYELLIADKKCTPEQGRSLVLDSVIPASVGARDHNERLLQAGRSRVGVEARDSFIYLSKSIRGAPTSIRRSVDFDVQRIFLAEDVDLEVVHELIETIMQRLISSSIIDPVWFCYRGANSDTVDRAAIKFVKSSYEALDPICQLTAEHQLEELRRKHELTAAAVCTSIVRSLHGKVKDGERSMGTFARELVACIAEVWLRHGLVAARARNAPRFEYSGAFHRYCELIVTALFEPDTMRHDPDFSVRNAAAQEAQRRAKKVSETPRTLRQDLLIRDQDVKEGLTLFRRSGNFSQSRGRGS